MSRYGASTFSSLLKDCVLWAPLQHSAGVSGDIDEFPIIPSGVTVTNNGTFTKTSLGNNRSVLNFDGSTNYVSLSDNVAWNFVNGDFTVSFWSYFNFQKYQGIFDQVITYHDSNAIYLDYPTNTFNFYGIRSGSVIFNYTIPYATQQLNSWAHVTIQRSGSTCIAYINGSQVAVPILTAFPASITDLNAVFRIGMGYVHAESGFIKDFMIHSRALTQPEIKLLMSRTNPDPTNGYGAVAGLMPANGEYYKLS